MSGQVTARTRMVFRGCPEQRFWHQDAQGQAPVPAPTEKTYPCKEGGRGSRR